VFLQIQPFPRQAYCTSQIRILTQRKLTGWLFNIGIIVRIMAAKFFR